MTAEHLVARYGERAYRLASRIVSNAEEAGEVVQQAFRSVLRRNDSIPGAIMSRG